MKHAISWFEIPATKLERAAAFYESIFGINLIHMEGGNMKMRAFPVEDLMEGIGGAVVESGGFHKPSSTDGPLIYLNGNPDLQQVLDRVEGAGGRVMMPKTKISDEYGYMGVFIDTEGNRIGLHSM